jgi:uncharacterized protein YndB with AHSA1/START domain
MKTYDVQSVDIGAPSSRVFDFLADPSNLPLWTSAFKAADSRSARLETPQGVVDIELRTDARREAGTIDWRMKFPDGAVATAYSRVTPDGDTRSVYSFVLMAPPVPLEAMEGALEVQRKTLTEELTRLKELLESK